MSTTAATAPKEIKSYVDLSTDNISMDALLANEQKSEFVENSIVSGKIVEKRNDGALVDIGYKAEGFIPAIEFRNWADVKVGDEVDVYLEEIENENSMPGISLQKANFIKSWNKITSEYGEGSVITGLMKHRVKGGIIIDLNGVEAFLPGSQIDIGPVKNMDDFIGKEYEFKILKINQDRRNIVVSRRELLEASRKDRRTQLLKDMEVNQIRKGVVKNITDFGAFIDLGGIDGLLHITDMSWGRISHPNEMLELGQEVEVMILDIDYDKERVSLGLKQKTKNPWDEVEAKYPIGSTVKGRIVNIMPYGAFVEIKPGVEGLIHVSEMSWSPRLRIAQDFLKVGDEVEAQILSLDREARKMSLGLKQLTPNPWESIREKYPVGSQHKAVVRNITNFGVFAELEDGIEGLVHISDLSWDKIKHPSEMVQVGDTIDVVILDFDEANHKLSLGHKQLLPNPWNELEAKYPVGTTVEATVGSATDKGANVVLEDGTEGFAFKKDLVKEDGKQALEGEKLPFVVTELRRSTRKLFLSHLKTYADVKAERAAAEVDNTKKTVKMINSNIEKTTLGDIDALAALKDKFEKGE